MIESRRRDRRRRDKLLIACAALGLVSAIVVGVYIGPALLNTSSDVGQTKADVDQVQRLTAENDRRIDDIARLTRENQQATDALCVLRSDLKRRVRAAQAFLREHPAGIPGIPAKTIRDGIGNQRRTIRALRGLSCPE